MQDDEKMCDQLKLFADACCLPGKETCVWKGKDSAIATGLAPVTRYQDILGPATWPVRDTETPSY